MTLPMYHYQLHPPTQICRHLTRPCQHHLEPAPLSSTFRNRSPTRPPLEREAGQPLEQRKTYAMPWQTCSVCPRYPFPSLLLLGPPALWQPSPPVNRVATSRITPLWHHQSLLPDRTHQSQRQAPLNDPSLGTSKILCIPSTIGACNKPIRNTSSRQDTTTQYHAHPQSSRAHSQPRQYHPKRPHPTRAQALAWRQPAYIRLA